MNTQSVERPVGELSTSRRMYWLIGLVALAAIIGGGLYFLNATQNLRISIKTTELQARVDSRLPFVGARGPLHYTVTRAIVDLRPDGRIAIDADVAVQVLGAVAEAQVLGSGLLEYKDGEFFVREVALEDAALDIGTAGAGKSKSPLRQIIESKTRVVTSAALRLVEDEVRKHGAIILGAVLDRYPVYRLKQENYKQALAKLVLEKVEVRDQTLIATLNVFGQR